MAHYIANQDGNWSTPEAWGKGSNTPTLHASTNITPTIGGVYSAAFTAPNITGNKSIGVQVFCATRAGTGDWTATLQEDSGGGFVDVAGATATITNASLIASNFLYFKWGTPYTYAVATANKYRIKLTVSVATSGTVAADSGGSNFMFIEYSDIGGPPVLGDRAWIITPNQSVDVSITVDGLLGAVGDAGTAAATLPLQRSITEAIHLNGYAPGKAVLKWDTTASATLTVKGNILRNYGGEVQRGTVASPYPAAYVATLILNQNGVSGTSGGRTFPGGRLIEQGTPKPNETDWKRTYVSGTGTAADPLIISAGAAFSVNDEIVITNSAYNTIEYKFIRTVINETTYELSDTKGGVESALAYAHTTNDEILNIERNVITTGTDSTKGAYEINDSLTSGNVDVDWTRIEYFGTTVSSKSGFYIMFASDVYGNCDYSVAVSPLHRAWSVTASAITTTFTGLVAVKSNASASQGLGAIFLNINAPGKTFVDCYAIGLYSVGFEAGSNATYTRCKAFACNQSNGSSGAGWGPQNPVMRSVFNDCEAHANRGRGIYLSSTMVDCTWTNGLFGSKGTNTKDLQLASVTKQYYTIVFDNCTFSSTTRIENYLLMLSGSVVAYHNLNATINTHIWYTNKGTARSCGSGLADTTVRTTGSLSVGIYPENAVDGFLWSFNIYANANNIVNFFGFFKLNAAFTGDAGSSARVELWLPGSSVADATATLSKLTNDWQTVSISANYTGSVDGLAEIRVYAISATSGAYLYADDFFNAGDGTTNLDKVTGLDTWFQGQPVSIISPKSISAADILTFSTSQLTTVGTVGYEITQTYAATIAAAIRAALGMESANLDTQLETIEHKVDDNQALIVAN